MNLIINIWIVDVAVESSLELLIYGFKESRCGLRTAQDIYNIPSPFISIAADDYDEGMMIHLQKKKKIVFRVHFKVLLSCCWWHLLYPMVFFPSVDNRTPTFAEGMYVNLNIYWEYFPFRIQDNLFHTSFKISWAWKISHQFSSFFMLE